MYGIPLYEHNNYMFLRSFGLSFGYRWADGSGNAAESGRPRMRGSRGKETNFTGGSRLDLIILSDRSPLNVLVAERLTSRDSTPDRIPHLELGFVVRYY